MLEVGWSEILVIAIILIVVVGPKDLPKMLRTFASIMKKVRGMASEFQGQFNEALRDAELDEVRKSLNDVRSLNPKNALKDAFNPLRQAGEDVKRELQKSQNEINAKASAPVAQPAMPVAAGPGIMPPAKNLTDEGNAPSFTPPTPTATLSATPPPALQKTVGTVSKKPTKSKTKTPVAKVTPEPKKPVSTKSKPQKAAMPAKAAKA
jgi:sec-independent protein translocase protein TatB